MSEVDLAVPETGTDIRAKLTAGGLVVSWFTMGSIPLVEGGHSALFDAGVLDLQHGLWDRMGAHLAVGAIGTERSIVRVAANTPQAIGEALDTGAAGVLVPLVESAEQARAGVAAATFPPVGNRSGGGVRPLSEGFDRYLKRSMAPLIGVMIETGAGIENAAQIAAVEGVDFVFIGTGDLALSLDCGPGEGTAHEDACTAILDACRSIGKPCGIFTGNAQAAARRLEQGYAFVVGANDIDIVMRGFAEAGQVARSHGLGA
ncbi:aldolase/citrate lyase family protein [Novosphingobium sp. 1949]|uniref:Aldolase/citrate lyase family protein n=1 Tax=Novosphingobium organovorum TaxID=2930092 RepID=A0ABT0BBJ2_9SPHN|nr:aldolase/citrate lyase family protein [Novosphingobium organovorum]MCJ2182426.1 aldolase/citrate lyase family protein [Novosphingobium organovorum]